MFSAARSRRLQIVPIVQSFAQLDKNYGKEGAEIIIDNTQVTIFGGFAPNSSTADTLSEALGNRTVLSGAVSKGKGNATQSLQMMERPLMTPDELKSLPKGDFIVMKTGTHPMRVHLKLFFNWGITFDEDKPYTVPERGNRVVQYAEKKELLNAIICKYRPDLLKESVDECMASHDRTEGIMTTGNGNQSHGCEIHQANEGKGKGVRPTGSKVVRTTAPANRVANPVSPTVQRASAQEGMENA